ncbi:hypothetical protein AEA09_00930 [Lysinibacillus contaminans]|uniref:Uncharacterized protein n=1 Tax=Lysinibacillus contaminans TaxID=1293441 RepID=A0ABR5K5F7_9BACI|nr:hypothetical protein [Lysinibacillus contaminans]KOS71584.1 hypothetical protein AEA09_00930 [Lysinibacillus contaminans]
MELKTLYKSYKEETKSMYVEYERQQTSVSLLNFVRAEARLNGFVTALQYVKQTKEIAEIIKDYKVGQLFK